MKSITLKSLFFGLFLVATFAVKAQEDKAAQYELATVSASGANVLVVKTNSTEPYEEITLEKGKGVYQSYLKLIQKFVNEGWTIVSVVPTAYNGTTSPTDKYYLKRKLK